MRRQMLDYRERERQTKRLVLVFALAISTVTWGCSGASTSTTSGSTPTQPSQPSQSEAPSIAGKWSGEITYTTSNTQSVTIQLSNPTLDTSPSVSDPPVWNFAATVNLLTGQGWMPTPSGGAYRPNTSNFGLAVIFSNDSGDYSGCVMTINGTMTQATSNVGGTFTGTGTLGPPTGQSICSIIPTNFTVTLALPVQ